MPKASNLYQRNGIWYARLQVAGAEIRQTLKTKDRREAERRVKLFLQETSEYHGTTRRSFDDVMDSFLLDAKDHLKPKTIRRYETSSVVLADTFSGQWWDQVTKDAVLEYIKERKAGGASVPTIKRDLTVLSQAAEWAIEHGCGGLNPVRQIGKRIMRHKKWKFIRPPERCILATIESAYGPLKDLAWFLRFTGLRLEEATTLEWHQIDEKRRALTVYETKNGLPRAISLSDDAMAILAKRPRKGDYVFPTRHGEPYKQASTNWQEAKARAQKAAQKEGWKYTPIRLHDLRHLYAIEYLLNGGGLYALQMQLGHSTVRQTEEYLDYLTPEEAEKVKAKVGTKTLSPTTVSD